MAGHDAVGYDPAFVHVHGGRGGALVPGEPARSRAERHYHVRSRALAGIGADSALHLPSIYVESAYGLVLLQRPGPDWPWIPGSLSACLRQTADAVVRRVWNPLRLLARLRALSLAAAEFRLAISGRAGRLATFLRLRGALGEELELRRGVRPLVPQPLSSRGPVHIPERRLPDPELH